MDAQNDFFTLQSLATFAGAVGATTVIANGCQRAFNFNPAWFALIVAEVICIAVVALTHSNAPPGVMVAKSDYFIAIINGFLVYCSAGGTTSLLNTAAGGAGSPAAPTDTATSRGTGTKSLIDDTPRRRFLSPWF